MIGSVKSSEFLFIIVI